MEKQDENLKREICCNTCDQPFKIPATLCGRHFFSLSCLVERVLTQLTFSATIVALNDDRCQFDISSTSSLGVPWPLDKSIVRCPICQELPRRRSTPYTIPKLLRESYEFAPGIFDISGLTCQLCTNFKKATAVVDGHGPVVADQLSKSPVRVAWTDYEEYVEHVFMDCIHWYISCNNCSRVKDSEFSFLQATTRTFAKQMQSFQTLHLAIDCKKKTYACPYQCRTLISTTTWKDHQKQHSLFQNAAEIIRKQLQYMFDHQSIAPYFSSETFALLQQLTHNLPSAVANVNNISLPLAMIHHHSTNHPVMSQTINSYLNRDKVNRNDEEKNTEIRGNDGTCSSSSRRSSRSENSNPSHGPSQNRGRQCEIVGQEQEMINPKRSKTDTIICINREDSARTKLSILRMRHRPQQPKIQGNSQDLQAFDLKLRDKDSETENEPRSKQDLHSAEKPSDVSFQGMPPATVNLNPDNNHIKNSNQRKSNERSKEVVNKKTEAQVQSQFRSPEQPQKHTEAADLKCENKSTSTTTKKLRRIRSETARLLSNDRRPIDKNNNDYGDDITEHVKL
jgi:hypothetical protein